MESPTQWIVLAQILRPQGRKGEVLADLLTDFPDRFATQPQVWLAAEGFAERCDTGSAPGPPPQPAEVVSHWLPLGRNSGRIVLHFAGVDSITEAERLAGQEVIVPISHRVSLESGAAYVSDLIGCTVYDGQCALGAVTEVQFPSSPDGSRRLEEAAPLLSILSPNGEEILVPFANEFLLELNVEAKSIRMKLPEGLVEINQAQRPSAQE